MLLVSFELRLKLLDCSFERDWGNRVQFSVPESFDDVGIAISQLSFGAKRVFFVDIVAEAAGEEVIGKDCCVA